MRSPELSSTLVGLIEALDPPPGSGLSITSAELDVPLEIRPVVRDGRLVLHASAPHSRWRSGFLPAVHPAHLVITRAVTRAVTTAPAAHGSTG